MDSAEQTWSDAVEQPSRSVVSQASVRPPQPAEAAAVQAVWERSFGHDDPAGRPRGGWSVDAWATDVRVLVVNHDQVVGVAAVRAEPGAMSDGVVPARVALEPGWRRPPLADRLVEAAIDAAQAAAGDCVRLFVPGQAAWTADAARRAGFEPVRTIFHMLRPADAPPFAPPSVPGLRIRSLEPGEEPRLLEALNRAWAGTWNFIPIRPEMLAHDLDGQRAGMLLGVDQRDPSRILATCHAVFDPTDRNPDGQPRAWISNLTVDPDHRGRGIGRAMLAAGLDDLRGRGAGSITLGVDAGDAAPLRLYAAAGFSIASRLEAWDKGLSDTLSGTGS